MSDSDSENNQDNNDQGNTDVSGNPPVTYDISGVTYTSPQIVSDLSSTTITGTGYEIEHAEGKGMPRLKADRARTINVSL